MKQIHSDKKLCKLLVDYETKSEIIGMMEFVRDLKMKPASLHAPERNLMPTKEARK